MVVQGALMGAAANSSLLVESLTRTVLLAALAAGVAALALAALIVRQITQPLDDLSRAAQRISAGDLSVRVGVQGDDEIGAVARSFNQMADGLQQQEKLRRNLVADVAHELRTPLTGIQGAVEAMQDGVFPADAENLEARARRGHVAQPSGRRSAHIGHSGGGTTYFAVPLLRYRRAVPAAGQPFAVQRAGAQYQLDGAR